MAYLESEKELEDYYVERLRKRGMNVIQQANLDVYGIADAIVWQAVKSEQGTFLIVGVIEFKVGAADFKALAQLCRYTFAVSRNYQMNLKGFNEVFNGVLVQGFLVCTDMANESEMGYLVGEMEDIEIVYYSLPLDGLKTSIFKRWPYRTGDDQFISRPLFSLDDLKSNTLSLSYEEMQYLPDMLSALQLL